jgi:hypothetical protein
MFVQPVGQTVWLCMDFFIETNCHRISESCLFVP